MKTIVRGREGGAAALLVLVVFLVLTTLVSAYRGLWYDEAWSLFYAHHDVSFGRALYERWLTDVHPPAFYMFAWLWYPVTGDSMLARRLLNIIPVLADVFCLWWLGRRDVRLRNFGIVLSILVMASLLSFSAMINHRSYTFQIAAALALVMGLRAALLSGADYEHHDRGVLLLLLVAIIASLNFHFLASLQSVVLYGVFVLGFWFSRRRRWAVRLFLAGVIASLPLFATYMLQHGILSTTVSNFWAATDTHRAVHIVFDMLTDTMKYNVAIVLVAVVVLVTEFRSRQLLVLNERNSFVLVCGIAVLGTCAFDIALNAMRPILIDRYLTVLVPFVAAVPCAIAAEWIMRDRRLLWLSALFSIAAVGWTYRQNANIRNWDATAAIVAEAVHRCADTAVHGVPRYRVVKDAVVLPNEAEMYQVNYRYVGAKFGFAVEPAGSGRMSVACPTLVWAEHASYEPGDSPGTVARGADLHPDLWQLAHATIREGEGGYVVSFPAVAARR